MKIALVSSRGGHLTEILQLLPAFEGSKFFFVTPFSYRDAEIRGIAPAYFFKSVDARLLPFVPFFFWSLGVLWRERPDVIVSLGAEVALPFFFWGRLLGAKTIYIESWCRLVDLSLTGRLAYRWVDRFWVQWPQLADQYGPRAEYKGSII